MLNQYTMRNTRPFAGKSKERFCETEAEVCGVATNSLEQRPQFSWFITGV